MMSRERRKVHAANPHLPFSRAKRTPKTFGICKTGLQALTNDELRGDRGAVHGDCNYPVLLRRQGVQGNPTSSQRFISPGLQLAVRILA